MNIGYFSVDTNFSSPHLNVPINRYYWFHYKFHKGEPVLIVKVIERVRSNYSSITHSYIYEPDNRLYFLPLCKLLDGTIPYRVLKWKADWRYFPYCYESSKGVVKRLEDLEDEIPY